ncbi:multidrug transporter [Brevibacterium sp. HMSC08F02]|uniref:multidrug transporter n=1 Tax=Brevibacterium sp. HMSC08F02 TaxID=1581140 RepID=UPI00210CF50A|nr:multidrug transporter [Brevibacterium sp. HMSC08F02]
MIIWAALGFALVSAVGLAAGAAVQHSGVTTSHDSERFGIRSFFQLFKSGRWLLGTAIMVIAVTAGVLSLALAPVMVVQPVGAISLAVSVLIARFARGLVFKRRVYTSVLLCVAGVAGFVGVSSLFAVSRVRFGAEALPMVWVSAALLAITVVGRLVQRRPHQLFNVVSAAILFACVATNTHICASQFLAGGLPAVTWSNLLCVAACGGIGSWFVQAGYASGPPEIVIAGLTVIDPIVAVILGVVVLGEAAAAPLWVPVIMVAAGLVACLGVIVLARFHPDVLERRERDESTQSPTSQRA